MSRLVLVWAALVVAAVFTSTAVAGSGGQVSSSVITYTAAPNEANNISVTKAAAQEIKIQDTGTVSGAQIQVLASGPGCTVTTTTFPNDTLDCNNIAPGTTLSISAGDGADQVIIQSSVDAGTNLGKIEIDGGSGDDPFLRNLSTTVPATFTGGPGNDFIAGSSSSDTIDTVSYAGAPGGVNVDLRPFFGSATGDGTDTVVFVPNVKGSPFNDTFQGSSDDNTFDGGGGTDTVDYSQAAAPVNVDLTGGTATGDGNDILVPNSIENVVASPAGGTITGNGNANVLTGGPGPDVLSGGGGNDTLVGAGGTDSLSGGDDNDSLSGGDGNDTLNGGAGTDTLVGGGDDDTLEGGSGNDTVDYTSSPASVTVSLATGAASGDGNDTLSGVENVTGSPGNDTIAGNSSANTLDGAGGDDAIVGGGGADVLNGGVGSDTLGDPSATGGAVLNGGGDDDILIGGATGTTTLNGESGNDVSKSGAGNDLIDGGPGSNTVDYSLSPTSITVDLQAGTGVGAGTDTLTNIQNATGSAQADQLLGDAAPNALDGGGGGDILIGRGGDDSLNGGTGTDTVSYERSAAPVVVGLGTGTSTGDGFDSLSNLENVNGSNYADAITGDGAANTLNGGTGNDTLAGGGGNDTLQGGSGNDTVDYSTSPAGVTVSLATGAASGDGNDTLSAIENVAGSSFDDVVNVRQGTINTVTCGAGADAVTADAFDVVAGDCESVAYPAPAVTSLAATNVTKKTATLHGTVNPNGTATTYHFEWGTTTAYGNNAPLTSAGSGFSPVAVSASIAGLKANKTYHFRLVATSGAGPSVSGDLTFNT